MNELLQNAVKSQQFELHQLIARPTIPRDKLTELGAALLSPLIKVITGPRRSGKSTLALQALSGKRFAYFNFENELLPVFSSGDELLEAIQSVYGEVDFYLFDEIQNYPRWEPFLNRLQRLGKNLVVTGSNSRLLSEELASALTGRHLAIELLPFSFSEIRRTGDCKTDPLITYLRQGGFPEVALGIAEFRPYLSTLWEAVILKDIVNRKKVRNVPGLRNLLTLVLSSMASRYNTESLTKALHGELSAPSAKKFLNYGAECFLIAELSAYSHKPRLRLKSDRKAYTVDNGFFSARHTGVFDDYGKLLENLVFVELWRRGYRPNLDLFYFQTKNGLEVDFLLRRGHLNLELIQAAASLGAQKTRAREYRSLLAAGAELGVSKLTIVTLNEDRRERTNGKWISLVPLEKWLLSA